MSCCTSYTYGILIGSLYIVASIIGIIRTYTGHYSTQSRTMTSLIIWAVIVVLSALFIVANVKKYEYLILPWLVAVAYVFYDTLVLLYWWFIGAGMGGASGLTFLLLFLFAVVSIVGEISAFCFSIWLFIQMHKENAELLEIVAVNNF